MPDSTTKYHCKIPQDQLESMSLAELGGMLKEIIDTAQSQYYQAGIVEQTHIRLRQVMQEFDNHLTFSTL